MYLFTSNDSASLILPHKKLKIIIKNFENHSSFYIIINKVSLFQNWWFIFFWKLLNNTIFLKIFNKKNLQSFKKDLENSGRLKKFKAPRTVFSHLQYFFLNKWNLFLICCISYLNIVVNKISWGFIDISLLFTNDIY